MLAAWDFADGIGPEGIPGDEVTDRGPNELHGTCVNFPARGMTGWSWDGMEENFVHAPAQYGAIHFHDDDLEDCRWETDITWTVPAGFRSGVYALRLQHGEAEDWVPFFVLPPRGQATAKALFLVPTASYLAYANERQVHDFPVSQAILGHTSTIAEQDSYLYGHSEFGLSTYDSALRQERRALLLVAAADPRHAAESTPGGRNAVGSCRPTCTSSTGSMRWTSSTTSLPTGS